MTAKTPINRKLNLSTGTTFDPSPTFKARKGQTHEALMASPDNTQKSQVFDRSASMYLLFPTKYTTPARAIMLTGDFPPPPSTTEEQERDRELASAGRDLFHRLGLGPFWAGDHLKLHLIPFI